MPYRWDTDTGEAPEISGASFHAEGDPPLARLFLAAHNSLSPRGFVIFFAATFALVLLPLLAVLGSPILWALLPFIAIALAAMWWALRRSWTDKSVTETLTIWSDRTELTHLPGRGEALDWQANTYWTQVHLHPRRGTHRDYITLTGSSDGREVELGSFLTREERLELHPELSGILNRAAAGVSAL